MFRFLPALFTVALACHASRPAPSTAESPQAADPLARFEGRWIVRGPYTPIHSGSDRVVVIARSDDGWTIAWGRVRHPGIVRKDQLTTFFMDRATPLAWREAGLEFESPELPGRVQRITADMRAGHLVLPCVVQRDARTWEYADGLSGGVFVCEHDPLQVPSGSAEHPDARWVGLPSSYRFTEKASLLEPGQYVPVIEFRQQNPEGGEDLCAELMLDRGVEGPYVRITHLSKAYFGRVWEPLSNEELARLRALPAPGR